MCWFLATKSDQIMKARKGEKGKMRVKNQNARRELKLGIRKLMEEELVVSNKRDDTAGVISMNEGQGPIHGKVHSFVVGFENGGLPAIGGGKSMVVNGGEMKVGTSRAHLGEMEFRFDQWRVQTQFLGMGRGNVQKGMELNGLNGQESYGSRLTNPQAQRYLNTPLSGPSVNIQFNEMGQAHVNELVVQKGPGDQTREMVNFSGRQEAPTPSNNRLNFSNLHSSKGQLDSQRMMEVDNQGVSENEGQKLSWARITADR
ncbi:hypothetical protein Patl1_18520 [Pistacia atlantica]|uniref:Uncharacterized protein n=1 Tax=Pistacia atlantica TaxID=434234 RepID=A0ACC1BYU7_9ROSI|nr:hypothetical protein Patl1_18520 [Pistacia atlantica]